MIVSLARAIRVITRIRADNRGFALTEFAITAPALILLYLGSFQLCNAISAKRKVTTTARALTDLTTQYQIVTDSQLDQILAASTQIMAPYDASNATMVISQINIDGSGNSKIDWSRGLNTAGRVPGSTIDIPTNIRQNNTSLILGEVTYSYSAGVNTPILGNMLLSDKTYMSPRTVRTIAKN